MMIEPANDRRAPITPQLAMRVAIFGAVAFGLFAIVFFRLWFLQVLSGDQYLAEANNNRFRELRIPAPRGDIVDRGGTVMVQNKRAIVVQLDPSKLPKEERALAAKWGQDAGQRAAKPKGRRGPPVPIPAIPTSDLRGRFERLARVIGDSSAVSIHRQVVRSLVLVPFSDVRVKTDVPTSVLTYVLERQEQFPGVTVEETYLRQYPRGTLAAQLLGTVGEISPDELKQSRFRGVKQGTIVGKEGLERAYDRYLRGRDGVQRVQVDASGRPIPNDRLRNTDPVGGQRLRVSLDLEVSRTAQRLLGSTGKPGAAVAMDPENGEIIGMASSPSFDPTILTKPITQKAYDTRFSEDAGSPRFNRAVSGLYPTGSVFKPITALAALQDSRVTADEPVDDPGCIDIGDREFCNAGKFANGPVDMRKAIQVSSDIYFYRMGQRLFPRGPVLQRWARRLGVGRTSGIDLAGERKGVVPDTKWREERKQAEIDCRTRKKIPLADNVFVAGQKGCGISDMRDYNLGDNVNLAVGQGDLQSNPLQMAIAYAAIANGGRVVRPHLGLEIEDDQGRLVQRIKRGTARRVTFDKANQETIMDGLRMAAQEGGGTSADVFADWPHDTYPVYGKTGTAERQPKADQSWYIAYVPDKERPIVLAVTVEEGGFGAATAAPIACQILNQYYSEQASCVPGKSRTQ